jgi:hypothetical protein
LTDEEYKFAIEEIRQVLPPEVVLRTISLTSSDILKATDYRTYPSVIKYDQINSIFDPEKIWKYCLVGEDVIRPNVDGVIFNESDNIAVAAYSKSAPIIVFEDEQGNKAICVMFRKQLEYIEIIFTNVLSNMGSNVTLSVPVCTHYNYPNYGTIPDKIKEIASNYSKITDVIIGSDTETDPNLFGSKDKYNNCVVVW